MAEADKDAARGPSFSEMTELPPLKESLHSAPASTAAIGRPRDGNRDRQLC